MANPSFRPVVLYDGRCGLCQRSVEFARKRAPDRFEFIASQEEKGAELLRRWGRVATAHTTLIVVDAARIRLRSDAVIGICRRMGAAWPLAAGLLWLVPRPLRDAAYRWVARHRAG